MHLPTHECFVMNFCQHYIYTLALLFLLSLSAVSFSVFNKSQGENDHKCPVEYLIQYYILDQEPIFSTPLLSKPQL